MLFHHRSLKVKGDLKMIRTTKNVEGDDCRQGYKDSGFM